MDYYEELGLKRAAPVQDIRQAYKVMARLVHPDGQANEQVRKMAERQMQRLNEILATLTDEQARREYDAELASAAGTVTIGPAVTNSSKTRTTSNCPPRGMARHSSWKNASKPLNSQEISWIEHLPEWVRPAAQNWFWISLGLVLVGVAVWYAAQDKPEVAGASLVASTDVKSSSPRELSPAQPQAQPRAATTMPPAAANDSSQITELQDSARPLATPISRAEPDVQPAARQVALGDQSQPAISQAVATKPDTPSSAPGATTSKPLSFAGNWLYVPDPNEKPLPGVYPATYVELLLADDRGHLFGNYRAEYRITDRAISPGVSFQVKGDTPPGASASLQWTSDDGAKGQFEMALIGPNLMKVTWWATELGRHSSLASGTAKLIRQQAR